MLFSITFPSFVTIHNRRVKLIALMRKYIIIAYIPAITPEPLVIDELVFGKLPQYLGVELFRYFFFDEYLFEDLAQFAMFFSLAAELLV